MSAVMKTVVSLACAVLAAACQHLPPKPTAGCSLPAYRLTVSDIRPGVFSAHAIAATDEVGFRSAFKSALRSTPKGPAPVEDLLMLSGGSQNGAFGAGFFAGLPQVPTFKVVTGVSTGALLSTLVFLANQPRPEDRVMPAYVGDYGSPKSNREDMARVYSIARESDLLDVGAGGQLRAVVKGSMASFAPLRRVIRGMLSPMTLAQLEREAESGRLLLAGVTNLNDGQAYAIDLTRYVANSRSLDRRLVQECYIDALLASSSVPPAMPPVRLRLHSADPNVGWSTDGLFIDGGARFGIFFNQVRETELPELKSATLVINGKLIGGEWEEFRKKGKWSILSLAERSVGILTNQIYRLSVNEAEGFFARSGALKEAFISNENLLTRYGTMGEHPDNFVWDNASCAAWAEFDERSSSPLEFHPHYMKCLVAYGRARGASAPWNQILSAGSR